MPEREVPGDGYLRLDYAEWKQFFEQEWDEWLRSRKATTAPTKAHPRGD